MKTKYIADGNGYYIKRIKENWLSSWKTVTTTHLNTTIPQLYRKVGNRRYEPI